MSSKQHGRPDDSRLLDIADAIGRQSKLDLSEDGAFEEIITKMSGRVRELRANPITVHGRRVEAMFGSVAAALGQCRAVKREDSGEVVFEPSSDLLLPDYRLLLADGSQLFVEVKNCHHRNPQTPFSIRTSDLDRLSAYAELFSAELRLAIYWSRWAQWTLVSADALTPRNNRRVLSFIDAVRYNRMAELGDALIATTPPLVFRVIADPASPRTVREDGHVEFRIGGVQFFAGGTEITDVNERNLLIYFMMYGDWVEEGPIAEIEGGNLVWIDFVFQPAVPVPDQQFDMIGYMSSMIAKRYNELTTEGEQIRRLTPPVSHRALIRALPGKVQDSTIPLWVFHVSPAEIERNQT